VAEPPPLVILPDHPPAPAAPDGSPLLACGLLHLYTPKIAEVRSLAVAPQHRGSGLGRLLVQALLEEARQRGLEMVFAFTYATDFFARLGFQPIDRAELPWKVWTDCVHCPKRLCCDEIAVAHRLSAC
jgi:amino-acid N-acetyltransferase